MFEPYAEVGARHYPARAIIAIVAAWAFSAALVAAFSAISWVALPLMPVFVLGPMFIIKSAHDYAHDVASHDKPRPPSDDFPIGSPYPKVKLTSPADPGASPAS